MVKRVLVLMSLMALFGSVWAAVPQDVVLKRSPDDRTLTVRYTGGRAALVELRINGESVATRSVNHQVTSGEIEFALDSARLKDGSNTLEVRLIDISGKAIATERSSLSVDRQPTGPVFIARPASGSMVQGAVDISVGFKSAIPGAFVSFFVDNEFQALKNFAPYSYLWDTTRVENGWHEVEAWVVDRANNTFRTQRLRVLVNNPGGRTERREAAAEPAVSANAVNPTVSGSAAASPLNASGQSAGLTSVAVATISTNLAKPVSGKAEKLKPTAAKTVSTNERLMTPTGKRVAPSKAPAVVAKTKPASAPVEATTAPKKTEVVVTKAPPAKAEATAAASAKLNPTKAATTPTAPSKPEPIKAEAPKEATAPSAPGRPAPARREPPKAVAAPAKSVKPAAPKMLAVTYGTRLPVSGAYDISYLGSPVKFDVSPQVIDGLALTPFRHLFEQAGGEVVWSHSQKSVEAKGLARQIRFAVGSDVATVDGDRVSLERSVFLLSGRTIVPLSFVQSILDVDVHFDPSTKHAVVTKKQGS